MNDERHTELSAEFKRLINNGDAIGPLAMANGKTSASITVATSGPGQSKDEQYWAFIIPEGYIRFSGNFEKSHNNGDSAQCDWANGNPADGTVYAKVRASGINGKARAAANNIYAIKPEAARNLYEQSK
ncbi:hypothetical protein AB9M92_01870 [Peribacillus frigoritolerans]|uniref:hypothetical protein n=1 Tax=Peribacillus frigoritolerans TaxID=450367 RepID=UPI0035165413